VPGVATGLAWTPVGGDILFIEATRVPGGGRLILTGQLGDVDANQAIDAVTCGEDVPRGKPHPDLFKLALKRLGVESGIAVGDTPYDAIAARRAGMRAIGLLTGGFSEAVLREAGCVDIVDDPAGLLSALDERLRL